MSDVFQFLTRDDVRLLAERARHIHFAAGEVIVAEGGDPRGIFVVRSGHVRIEKRRSNQAQMITTLGAGEVFGEISFIDNRPASASVLATEPTDVDILERTDIYALLSSVPGLSSRFYQSIALMLAERLRTTTDSLTGL